MPGVSWLRVLLSDCGGTCALTNTTANLCFSRAVLLIIYYGVAYAHNAVDLKVDHHHIVA